MEITEEFENFKEEMLTGLCGMDNYDLDQYIIDTNDSSFIETNDVEEFKGKFKKFSKAIVLLIFPEKSGIVPKGLRLVKEMCGDEYLIQIDEGETFKIKALLLKTSNKK